MMFGSNTCLNEEEAAIKFIHQAQILHRKLIYVFSSRLGGSNMQKLMGS